MNFRELMSGGVTSASTIVGHTSVSNPSWTTIQTGVWSETAGVTNNVFTPWTYDNWPTVYNQLEAAYGDRINTTVIGNWPVITDTAGAGRSLPTRSISSATRRTTRTGSRRRTKSAH